MSTGAIQLGTGVSISSGLAKNLGYLLDCNGATYEISSGSDWHLLAVLAKGSWNNGVANKLVETWTYELVSKKVSDLKTEVGTRFVDKHGLTVNKIATAPGSGGYSIDPALMTGDPAILSTEPDKIASWPPYFSTQVSVEFWDDRQSVFNLTEIGTHILPVAYHRIVDKSAQVVQVARSDFHFWPIPTLPIWSKMDDLVSVKAGTGTVIPE